jgi:hypothetical protein
LFGEEPTLAFSRVIGARGARIVDAAISLFYGEFAVTPPGEVIAMCSNPSPA